MIHWNSSLENVEILYGISQLLTPFVWRAQDLRLSSTPVFPSSDPGLKKEKTRSFRSAIQLCALQHQL